MKSSALVPSLPTDSPVQSEFTVMEYGQIASPKPCPEIIVVSLRRRMSHCFPQMFLNHTILRRIHRGRLYRLRFRSLLPRRSFLTRAIFKRTQSVLLYSSQPILLVRGVRCQHIKCSSPPNSELTLTRREPPMNLKSPSTLTSRPFNPSPNPKSTQLICHSFLSYVKSRQPLKSLMIQGSLLSTLELLPRYVLLRFPAKCE